MSWAKRLRSWRFLHRLSQGRSASPTRLIIVQGGSQVLREVRIPPGLRRILAGAAAVTLLGAAHYGWLLLGPERVSGQVVEERDALRQLSRGYARDTERMARRMEAFELQMRKLALLAGVEPVATRVAGVGGPAGAAAGYDYVSERLEDLSGRIASLDRQAVALERTMREKSKLLASAPSIWPVRGYLSSGFGQRHDPFTDEIEWHYGLDILAATGTPVRVTADGVVIEASTSATFGKYVVVSHGLGAVTRYAHLSRVDVRRSQRLRRGQVVGLVGSTGRSRSPHLHYEVWLHERAQNPLDHIVDYTP